jgi:Ca-activated chloride channel family protein
MSDGIEVLSRVGGEKVSLRGVRMQVEVAGLAMCASVEQTFVNLEEKAIEAVYAFPLPASAAVTSFEVRTDDRVLTGVLEEREKAVGMHDDAMRRGDGSFLAESIRNDVLNISAGNLLPGQAATVKLSYVSELESVDGEIRLTLPTAIAPRYVTASGEEDLLKARMDGDAMNPPRWASTPYGLELDASLQFAFGAEVTSPTHEIEVTDEAEGEGIRVRLRAARAKMDRDVVLVIKPGRSGVSRKEGMAMAVCATGQDGQEYVAVTVVPAALEESGRREAMEIAFVVDCSGSMEGASIQKAKEALALCIKACLPGDVVWVLRFGSTYEYLTGEPVTMDGLSASALLEKVAGIQANLGGTEMLAPLADLLERRPVLGEGRRREVVLMTDGQVSNEEALVRLARGGRGTNRIFTLGIGSAPSHSLLSSMAGVTGGSMESAVYSESLGPKVLRLFNRLGRRGYTGIEVDAGIEGAEAEGGSGGVFAGQAVTEIVRLPRGKSAEGVVVRLRVDGAVSSVETVRVRRREELGATMLGVFARRRIRALEAAGKEKEAVAVSLGARVLCAGTAWIAVEHRSEAERNDGKPELRRIPVTLAAGWGAVDDMLTGAPQMGGANVSRIAGPTLVRIDPPASRSAPSQPRQWMGFAKKLGRFRSSSDSEGKQRRSFWSSDRSVERYDESREVAEVRDELLELLGEMEFEGFFNPGRSLKRVLKGSGVDKPEMMKGWSLSVPLERAVCTAWALRVLRVRYPDREAEWKAAGEKAMAWLKEALGEKYEEVRRWIEGTG